MLGVDYIVDYTVKENPMKNYSQCLIKSDKPYVERMIEEYNQLVTRFNALEAFIEGSHIFKELPAEKQILQMHKRRVMDEYIQVLGKLIEVERFS